MSRKILFVDDDPKLRTSVERMLGARYDLVTAASGEEGLTALREDGPFAVIISDIKMPGMDGLEFLSRAREVDPYGIRMVLSGYTDLGNALSAVNSGNVFRIMSKPSSREDIVTAIEAGLEQRELLRAREENASLRRLRDAMDGIVTGFGNLVEARDPYTAGHQRNVTGLAVALAEEMDLEPDRILGLRLAAGVHDIGKIYVPAEFLNRPGRLTPEEFAVIKQHPEVGYSILAPVEFPWPVADIVRQHHERQDGSGYPQGLAGEAILLEARILAVADVVDAISSHRPYRPGKGVEAALAELEDGEGARYDADVVGACLRLFREQNYSLEVAADGAPQCEWLACT